MFSTSSFLLTVSMATARHAFSKPSLSFSRRRGAAFLLSLHGNISSPPFSFHTVTQCNSFPANSLQISLNEVTLAPTSMLPFHPKRKISRDTKTKQRDYVGIQIFLATYRARFFILPHVPLHNTIWGDMAQEVRAVVWQSEGCRFDPALGVSKCPWARHLTPNCSWRAGWYLAWQSIAVGVCVCVWTGEWEA